MKIILLLCLSVTTMYSQTESLLFEKYEQFKEPTITHRRFKHADLQPLINRLKNNPDFRVKKIGESIEGRAIHLISIGQGKTDVLLWSQMHGDEPTATMAITDLFNFFNQNDSFGELRALLNKELTLHFIPLLNPDGAEKYQRRNALGIDLNRDALRLECPESQLLKAVRDSLQAVWGFNLHDQSRYYAVGKNAETASISFLAPAFNPEKHVNEVRKNAMRLIGVMQVVLQKYIPGKIARYYDEFEPRAFGDNMTKWGTSTILIETGGLENDPEKQYLRKLNFIALLSAFKAIANQSYKNTGLDIYQNLPFNKSGVFHDLIVRKLKAEKNGKHYRLDLAFQQAEINLPDNKYFYYRANIVDIGDLSHAHGYEEWDASGYDLSFGKTYPESIPGTAAFRQLNVLQLLQEGYLYFFIENLPPRTDTLLLPFSFLEKGEIIDHQIGMGENPSLLFSKNGKVEKIVVNGNLFDLNTDREKIKRLLEKIPVTAPPAKE